MKKYLILTVIVLLTACSSDNNSSSSSIPELYRGDWTGTYTGTGDVGVFDVTVSSNGNVTGQATSITFSESYDLTGKVTSNGNITATFGTSSIGGTFTGTLASIDNASGTWINNIPDPDLTGTWTGTKVE